MEPFGKDKKRPFQFLDVKVTMENRVSNEAPIEELLERIDISKCLNDGYDAIILSNLLTLLHLSYNIPTDSTSSLMQIERSSTFAMMARYLSIAESHLSVIKSG